MNKWFSGVCAVIAAGSLAQARTTGDDWLTLDEEIDRLSSSTAAQNGGPTFGALLRAVYVMADEGDGGAGFDVGGFDLFETDIWLEGSVGDTRWRVSTDLSSGTSDLEDAFANMALTDQVGFTMGQFKNPTLHQSRVDPEHQMFLTRSFIASAFDMWDRGAMVDGTTGQFGGFFSVQNGDTGLENKHSYLARLEAMFGDSPMATGYWPGRTSGALADETWMVGVFHYEDDVASDNAVNGIDFAGRMRNIRLEAEVVDVDEDATGSLGGVADTTPWDIAGQLRLNERFDVGLRYQDLDDDADSSAITIGAHYFPGDPTVFWSAEVDMIDSDDDDFDGEVFRVGLTLGQSRTR